MLIKRVSVKGSGRNITMNPRHPLAISVLISKVHCRTKSRGCSLHLAANLLQFHTSSMMSAKDRMKIRRAEFGRPSSFKIECPGNQEQKDMLLGKLRSVRGITKQNNTDLLHTVLDFWKLHHPDNHNETQGMAMDTTYASSYVPCSKEHVNQELFISTKEAMNSLLLQVEQHRDTCEKRLLWTESSMHGHVCSATLSCGNSHSIRWKSSPYLPNGKFMVNYRVATGYLSSGMIPSQYQRFCEGVGVGAIPQKAMDCITKEYAECVKEEMVASCSQAINEEQASSSDDGITIVTDARHGWRKNAKDTDVVCIGYSTHKVLCSSHITWIDDHCTQRHELIGTKRIYQHLESKQVKISAHAHDSNASINKYIREEKPNVVNQNDTWHVGVSMKKAVSQITKGAQYKHGVTWHWEIQDKASSIITHTHWAMRNCNGDPKVLRDSLDNVVAHYQNNHEHCHPTSRCRSEALYELSKVVLADPVAINLLTKCIKSSAVYKRAPDFVKALDTCHVESFNNVLNVFHDKRIVFQSTQYEMRTDLTVCHWNENVDRPYTSFTTLGRTDPSSRQAQKKNYKDCTYNYRTAILGRLMDKIYG